MAREGTRSATGNSKPRVLPVVETAPTITRKKVVKPKPAGAAAGTQTKPAVATKGAKPLGVTKKKPAPKKEGGLATKAKAVAKKVAGKADGAGKEAKAKTSTKKQEPAVKA